MTLFGKRTKLFLYGAMMLFIYIADGVMSYLSPVFIEERMHNTLLMGIILSTSSMVGLISDMAISKMFVQKEYRFFLRWLIGLAMFFPLSFLLLPLSPFTFLIAMAVWGVYYEFIAFSQYNFVTKVVNHQQHAHAWGIIDAFKSAGLLIAPLLATTLLHTNTSYPLLSALVCLIIAGVFYLLFFAKDAKEAQEHQAMESKAVVVEKRSFTTELKIWSTLLSKIWPVYLFFFMFIVLETSFWVIGPLLMEEVRDVHVLGGFILSAYILPSFLMPLYVQKLGSMFGKKRTAFASAAIGSLVLGISAYFFSTQWYFALLVGLSSLFLSLDYPEIEGVFEDYISRAEEYRNDIIGLHGTASSLAYIVGPSLAGALALELGTGRSIAVFALALSLVSVVLLIVTPRKIALPQQKLKEVVT